MGLSLKGVFVVFLIFPFMIDGIALFPEVALIWWYPGRKQLL